MVYQGLPSLYLQDLVIITKVHDFHESIQLGKKGEAILLDYLNRVEAIKNIKDVTDNKDYFELDIDYIVEFTDGSKQTLEVKTDFTKYPNLFYELVSCVETGSIGCFEKTKAERLMYLYVETGELFTFDMHLFRNWVNENKQAFEKYKKTLKNSRYDGSYYTTQGFAIPKKLILENNWVNQMFIPVK